MSDYEELVEFDPEKSAAIETLLVSHVRKDLVRSASHRRWRITAAIGIPALLVAGALTAGVILLADAPISDSSYVNCFSRAEIYPDGTYPGSSTMIAGSTGSQIPIQDAIDACSALWEQGVFQLGFDPTHPSAPGTFPVPDPLTVCVMSDGSAAVIPGGRSVCASLGLARRE